MKDVVIVGGGSSVKEGIEKGLWEQIKDKEVWSLNFAFMFMPYLPKRQLWIDTSFFRNYCNKLQELHSHGVSLHTKKNEMYDQAIYKDKITTYEVARNLKEPIKDRLFVGQMGLTGLLALHLAIIEQYDTIYLLGYDYGTPDLNDRITHFYSDKVVENDIKSSGVANTRVYLEDNNAPKKNMEDLKFFNDFSNKIYNVSLKSNITYFEKISYEEFFNKIKGA